MPNGDAQFVALSNCDSFTQSIQVYCSCGASDAQNEHVSHSLGTTRSHRALSMQAPQFGTTRHRTQSHYRISFGNNPNQKLSQVSQLEETGSLRQSEIRFTKTTNRRIGRHHRRQYRLAEEGHACCHIRQSIQRACRTRTGRITVARTQSQQIH